jgi:N-acetylmuramoyl-L-alanine amidase
MKYSIHDHLLYLDGKQANYKASPNRGGIIKPSLVVIHYTGSNSLQGALSWLCTPSAKVSAHLVIAKTGDIWQLLPFNIWGWHAGRSEYDGRGDVNGFSIGIENVGLGDEWPEAQIQANVDVIQALCQAYKIVDLVGHDEVAIPEGRKVDPGPKYPWKRVGDACGFKWEWD